MNDGRIVPMTSETLNNYVYQEISEKIALMVDRGELDAQYVINEVQKKLPQDSLNDLLTKLAKQNVRRTDFGLKEAARAAVDMGESREIEIDLPKDLAKKAEDPEKAEPPAKKPVKVNI